MFVKKITIAQLKYSLKEIESYIAGHSGHIKLVSWQAATGVIRVRLDGSCKDCALSTITLHYGVLRHLEKKFPQVNKVEVI